MHRLTLTPEIILTSVQQKTRVWDVIRNLRQNRHGSRSRSNTRRSSPKTKMISRVVDFKMNLIILNLFLCSSSQLVPSKMFSIICLQPSRQLILGRVKMAAIMQIMNNKYSPISNISKWSTANPMTRIISRVTMMKIIFKLIYQTEPETKIEWINNKLMSTLQNCQYNLMHLFKIRKFSLSINL